MDSIFFYYHFYRKWSGIVRISTCHWNCNITEEKPDVPETLIVDEGVLEYLVSSFCEEVSRCDDLWSRQAFLLNWNFVLALICDDEYSDSFHFLVSIDSLYLGQADTKIFLLAED